MSKELEGGRGKRHGGKGEMTEHMGRSLGNDSATLFPYLEGTSKVPRRFKMDFEGYLEGCSKVTSKVTSKLEGYLEGASKPISLKTFDVFQAPARPPRQG